MDKLIKQSRGVLAGAYVSTKQMEKASLTHMVLLPEGDMSEGEAVCGRAKNLADGYGMPDPYAPPTCPHCLKKWKAV